MTANRTIASTRYEWSRDHDLVAVELAKLKTASSLAYDKCEGSMSGLLGCFTVDMLVANPESARRWPATTGDDLATLLIAHPDAVQLCDWGKLDLKDWKQLLCRCPECAKYCPRLDWLDEDGWVKLLSRCPEYAASCEVLGALSGEQWECLLLNSPALAERCDWSRFKSENWAKILKKHPEWESHCPFGKFSHAEWAILLASVPRCIEKCPVEILTGPDWAQILAKQPSLETNCDKWDALASHDWLMLLGCRHDFSGRFRATERKLGRSLLDGIKPGEWARTLWHKPQLSDYCDKWGSFSSEDWRDLLFRQPTFADRCKIGEQMLKDLRKKDISRLVETKPELANVFPAEKLAAKLRRSGGGSRSRRIGGTCMSW